MKPEGPNAEQANGRKAERFAPTRWTLVLRARGRDETSRQALSELCESCYGPVEQFLRSGGRNPDEARELTQEFFARLLRGGGLDGVDPLRGRFRSFLLGAVKHFLADAQDRARAQKRGGGQELIPLTSGSDTTAGMEIADPAAAVSDVMFDRQWALALLDRVLREMQNEALADGRERQFEALKPWLTGADAGSQRTVAEQLGMTEGAVKVAIHRLRQRFRDGVRRQIAETLDDPAEVTAELSYLIQVVTTEPQ